jgi:hypothetical protein
MKNKILLTGMLMILAFSGSLMAQTLPVGSLDNIEDAYRRQQLLGEDASGSSFMIRPLFLSDKNEVYLSQEDRGFKAMDLNKCLLSGSSRSTVIIHMV